MAQYMVHSNEVITAQPTGVFATTTVVATQPQAARYWSSNTCDCFNDMKSCLCSFLCGNFYYCTIATRMGEHCCVGCSGDPMGCVPGGHLAMRTKLRTQHNIQGDICGDCVMMHCCKSCAMCQIARELDRLGYPNDSACC